MDKPANRIVMIVGPTAKAILASTWLNNCKAKSLMVMRIKFIGI